MSLVGKALTAARSVAGMTLGLSRATRRPDMAVHFALRALAERNRAVSLAWQGQRLCARGIDWAALQEILIEDEYGVLRSNLMAVPSPVVLDIGANIGAFALFAFTVNAAAVVHSFEPSARTFGVLDVNRGLNSTRTWQVHQAAAWSDDASISFSDGLASTSGRVGESGDEMVRSLSLASILRIAGDRADIAKIDIEGAEEALLVGRSDELARIDTLVVELHPGRCNTEAVIRSLRESYGELFAIPGRRSSKPLLFATRSRMRPQLPVFHD